jgi:DNA gyrase subunit B
MEEIIQRGHLYIAQPPLYKISEGKRETYLKDDDEYHEFLVQRIQDSWVLEIGVNGGHKKLKGPRMANFLNKVADFRRNLDRLAARGYPEDALRVALVHGLKDKKTLADEEKVREIAEIIEASGFHSVELGHDEEHGTGIISFISRRDGVERRVKLDWDLLSTAEYRAMARNKQGLEALQASAFSLAKDGEDKNSYESLDETLETLYTGARKGLGVQRYKGLGEMNAGQLWETTMDPEKRRLLKVRIDDQVGADAIFTVLMGDKVEPRREFIEENALNVKNLDV